MLVFLKFLVDPNDKPITLNITEPAPVLEKKVIVQNIQSHTREASPLPGKYLLAGQHLRMLIGEAVHGPVVANALPHCLRECRQINPRVKSPRILPTRASGESGARNTWARWFKQSPRWSGLRN